MFLDRTDAGRQLATALVNRGVDADVVLGLPRGGLPVARPVADALGVPLDIAVAKKLGAPNNPEYAIGAVAADGSVWLNETAIARLGVDDEYLEAERERAVETARGKERTYRETEPVSLSGMAIVLVDDGVATGATVTACLRMIRGAGAARVVLAVPVAPAETLQRLRAEADELVVLAVPTPFRAVGEHYEDFGQVTDEEAAACLRG